MKKSIFAILMMVLFLLSGFLSLKVEAEEISPSMQMAYEEIVLQRQMWGMLFSVEEFDIDVWNEYNVLVVDIPGTFPTNLAILKVEDGKSNDYNSGAGEYRYIGYNPDGYLVNNPRYPDDHSGSAMINTYDWQKNTDKKTNINQYISSDEDKAFYENEIFYFLEKEYGPRFDETVDPSSWLTNAIVIVPVSSTGKGVIKYMHKWDSNHDGVEENWYITVNLRSMNEVQEEFEELAEESIEFLPFGQLEGHGVAVIQADPRGQEAFNAEVAVPTLDSLYVQVQAREYVYEQTYQEVEGTKLYPVTVTRTYKLIKGVKDEITGEVKEVSKTVPVTKNYQIARPYHFYLVQRLGVFSLGEAIVENPALPSGRQTLISSVQAPVVELKRDMDLSAHIIDPVEGLVSISLPTKSLGSITNRSFPSVPSENFRTTAEAAVGQIQVNNDGLMFNGQILMDDRSFAASAPEPKPIPESPLNNANDLYKDQLIIEATLSNGLKTSQGELIYHKVIDTENRSQWTEAMGSVNPVTVHTPVVCYPVLDKISKETQQVTYDGTIKQVVIGETFHIQYPRSGQHTQNQGYGDRDYSKYYEVKQVAFPFDVYVGTGYDGLYFPKNTWGNFNSLEATFFIPSWEEEREGDIRFRSIPINIQDLAKDPFEYYANFDLNNYKAVESIPFHLSSKVYDFRIRECPDDYWSTIVTPATSYMSEDLPIKPKDSRQSTSPDEAIMLGYPIVFDLVTNGDLYDPEDYIEVQPTYDYVPVTNGIPDFSKRQAVEVYVSQYNQIKAFEGRVTMDKTQRSFVGDISMRPPSISENAKERSVQQWRGQFHLPNMSYFLAQGTQITQLGHINLGEEPFLHDGYIIVNFDISVYKRGRRNYLNYGKGWSEEGFRQDQDVERYHLGDVVIYSASRRASQTYR